MNPGLPGLGIGGLFYILCALAMPLVALLRVLQGRPALAARGALAVQQCAIALGIVASMTLAFWALDVAMVQLVLDSSIAKQLAHEQQWHALRVSALAVTAGVLTMVLGGMHVTRLLTRRRRPARLEALARKTR